MNIIKFEAENIKNLKVVQITPDGNTVILSGPNGSGKSAILETIFSTLTGKKLVDPIRHGEERAEATVDLGEYVVKKVWTGKGEYLEVRSKEGAKFPSPQALLNKILGDLSFDPLAFDRMKPREQYEVILELSGVDLAKFEETRKGVYDERTVINREVGRTKGVLSTLTEPRGDVPGEEVDVAVQAAKVNSLKEQYRERIDGKTKIDACRDRLEEIGFEIAALESEMKKKEHEIKQIEANMPDPVDPETIRAEEEKLSRISVINQSVRDARAWNDARAEHEAAKAKSDELTKELENIDRALKKKVASLELPIDGLAVEGEQVMYNGTPLSRLSRGEKIRVSTALAMAMNPEFRVIFIEDGSSLDSDGMNVITDLADNLKYQVWIERVDETGQVGIVLRDGEVVVAEA